MSAAERPISAWGFGLVTKTLDSKVLDVWFPELTLGEFPEKQDRWLMPTELTAQEYQDDDRGVIVDTALIETKNLQGPVTDTQDAYLRLHLLSLRLVKPNSINLDGIFGVLPNVVWTANGPVEPSYFAKNRVRLQRKGVTAVSYDKFPRLIDYVIPDRVRIADVQRVRLGAYLSPGTTVMHEGFVNFNAGTLGTSIVEGRISQGVVIGDGSDIGGGASIMGTLSGGGTHKVSVGERSLLGANSGIGISLGDDCVVEAGLYVTAGTKVQVLGPKNSIEVKAKELSGQNGLLFRRNSLTGAVEVIARSGKGIELNPVLHA
ncbi:MAG: 2,3,4,5-tetrahydropyridine-2,6-dicarboxylate N-succinyltransferase [Microbacteriaceae bacterium]|nr:2,3,4,5-tetrahydropyridine-2,6-dicarboxylate N-succinyltransferase [Microbacteriaceae bacterium]